MLIFQYYIQFILLSSERIVEQLVPALVDGNLVREDDWLRSSAPTTATMIPPLIPRLDSFMDDSAKTDGCVASWANVNESRLRPRRIEGVVIVAAGWILIAENTHDILPRLAMDTPTISG